MIADPLTWSFAQIVRLRNAYYNSGRANIRRLRLPVISVGNLSVGGSGKTPFVQTLGRWLHSQGIPFDVLSRGYGRKSHGVFEVDPSGPAALYGDEPLLLARTLRAPVFVGEDRYAAGLAAEARFAQSTAAPRLHILDDGFQHRRLHRDFDIVLLGQADLRAHMLPFGRLREPVSSLGRAQAVAVPVDLAPLLDAPNVWHIRRRLVLSEPAPTRPLAFCGLARPRQFWQSLADVGIHPVATYAFSDHHRYTSRDIDLLRRLARRHDANGFLTTEKDLVKLEPGKLTPISAPALTLTIDDADALLKAMLRTIELC